MNNKWFWNDVFKNVKEKKLKYDLWLDEYIDILEKIKEKYIIDLGCGCGGDILYLIERGYNVIVCDCLEEVLNIINKFFLEVKII